MIYLSSKMSEDLICGFCDKVFTAADQCEKHEKSCLAKHIPIRRPKQTPNKESPTCHICGSGHHPSNCRFAPRK